jgi:transcriptional regulator with XRE-family HTH domain
MSETFGQVLRRLRGDLSQRALAGRAHISKSLIAALETGTRPPTIMAARTLDTALNANGELISSFTISRTSRQISEFPPSATEVSSLEANAFHDTGEDDTNRRRLLHLAASAGIGALGFEECVRHLLDLGMEAHRSIEDWTTIVIDDHLHALRTRPPAQLVKDLALDLYALREQMSVSPPDELCELHRVTAVLACVQANALTRLAEHGAAIRWWNTSRTAAEASGDLDLRLTVCAEEAGHGLYGQRTPEIVLKLIDNARRISTKPWPRLMTAEAEALAMLGRHEEAAGTVRTLEGLMERGLTGDRLGMWMDDAIPFCKSWVYGLAGDEAAADEAREQVLTLAPEHSYQVRTNVWLHRAACTVSQGGVDGGVRGASELVDSLPATFRTNHIVETARMVLRTVPPDQQARPAVWDLRSVLAAEA